jgi:hypothetical protein
LALLYKIVPELSISGKKETSAPLIKVSSATGGSTTGVSFVSLPEQEKTIPNRTNNPRTEMYFFILK